ncbi:ATP-grasp domain-containing protein [Cytophagaceae bacterium DM2B3-1]|uniref:ATP-grasp domain-containing protein n=1 Tax=Xanthocytophaga flava TaxID=3048013 RepID=A0ABT7CW69_9BACT|nr:ATP-grasp domain-containing protein [Xanthocytophaga flavus]MDJ1498019.1 ATP-grasp domain-containing protein [Xanthocytophaga flavus]
MLIPSEITLFIPYKSDTERLSVAAVWQNMGGQVIRLDRFWEKPANLLTQKFAIYGNDTFSLVSAQLFALQLISPDDLLLTKLAPIWTKRQIHTQSLDSITDSLFPIFIKSVVPKQFKAAVYQTKTDLLVETEGLAHNTQLLVSEIVAIEAEARCFVLQYTLKDIAIYEGTTSLETGKEFIQDFLDNVPDLPQTFVVDLGYSSIKGWFILEFNASWGAGLNGCAPEKVIECIIAATINP